MGGKGEKLELPKVLLPAYSTGVIMSCDLREM